MNSQPPTMDAVAQQADPRPRAALETLGCRLNHAETELIRRKLVQAGYRIVPWGDRADVMVLNSCTVTAEADATSRQTLRRARRDQPGATLAIVGCHAQVHAQALAESGLADLIVGNGDKLAVVDRLIHDAGRPSSTPRVVRPPIRREAFAYDFDPDALVAEDSTTRAHLKIQEGCDFVCSFCVIPRARGPARSRSLDNLIGEAAALADLGIQEIVLTGVNIGTFAEGIRTLVDAVDRLDALPGLARIRVSSIEPTTVEAGLLERMASRDHKLVPFLHLPLQSGSDAMLQAMRRRYTAGEYEAFAVQALERVPDLCLGTDVMAGFPGEDERRFEQTLDLLERLEFAYFHVFPYSERPHTAAVHLPDAMSAAVRHSRVAALRDLSDAKRLAFHRRFVGRSVDVLFEKPRRPDLAEGYSANFIRVKAAVPDAAALRNCILPVRLSEAGPHSVAGELDPPVSSG